MPKPEPTIKQAIETAIEDLHKAYLENIEASKGEQDAKIRKSKAYHVLLKAKERMRAIEQQVMEEI